MRNTNERFDLELFAQIAADLEKAGRGPVAAVAADWMRGAADEIRALRQEAGSDTGLAHNPALPQNALCACEHPYYRHFDTYEDMKPVGCKYCDCRVFQPAESVQ